MIPAKRTAFEVDPAIRLEMARLQKCGLSLIPLGGGTSGKSPLVMPKSGERLSLRQVLGPMHGRGSHMYGIMLSGLTVLDADDPAFLTEIEARFGVSTVIVKTPRGYHAYYRGDTRDAPSLRGCGWPVDVKRGGTSYVVGPRSQRPDGGLYEPFRGALGKSDLAQLLGLREDQRSPSGILEGERHSFLLKEALGMVRCVDDPAELASNLLYSRNQFCGEGSDMPDGEVESIAAWAWQKRLEGSLYAGRDSAFTIHRSAFDRIKADPDALCLWVALQDQHGHTKGRTFALDHEGMRKAGHTGLSRRRFQRAIVKLTAEGLLEVAATHREGERKRQYRLKLPFHNAGNVLALRTARS